MHISMSLSRLALSLFSAASAHAFDLGAEIKAGECTFPPALNKQLKAAIDYKKSCASVLNAFQKKAASGTDSSGGKIAISDYTQKNPTMYIFSSDGKTCLAQQKVDFGSGGGKMTAQPSCKNGSKATPPGFHVTATDHTSGKYPPPKSLLMVDLEGQGSGERHILIHHAAAGGVGCTWGCSGVPDFDRVKDLLEGGSLVYNYFGDKAKNAEGCGEVGKNAKCKAGPYAKGGSASPSPAARIVK